jgi:hypothetical protein
MPCARSSLTFDVLQEIVLLLSVKFSCYQQLAMPRSSMPAYYLIMGGGSLTIVTSLVILFSGALNSYYTRFFPIFSSINLLTAFALTLLPGLAVLYLGQRFLNKPKNQLRNALAVAALSIVSLFGIVGSTVSIYVGILFSGPPISFTGGIIGAFLSRTGDSSPPQPNPQP